MENDDDGKPQHDGRFRYTHSHLPINNLTLILFLYYIQLKTPMPHTKEIRAFFFYSIIINAFVLLCMLKLKRKPPQIDSQNQINLTFCFAGYSNMP